MPRPVQGRREHTAKRHQTRDYEIPNNYISERCNCIKDAYKRGLYVALNIFLRTWDETTVLSSKPPSELFPSGKIGFLTARVSVPMIIDEIDCVACDLPKRRSIAWDSRSIRHFGWDATEVHHVSYGACGVCTT